MSNHNTAWIERLSILALACLFLLILRDGEAMRPGGVAPVPPAVEVEGPVPERPVPRDGKDDECRPRSECCRVCKKGQACGDACISEKVTCRKTEDGCACDAEDVCR